MKSVTPLKFAVAALALVALLAAGVANAEEKTRGWLGVSLQELSPSLAEAYQLQDGGGVLVNEVVADSPADKAGLEDGDVIISYAGQPIESSGDLVRAVRGTTPGQNVNVVVVRDGTRRTLKVEIAEKKSDDERIRIQLGDDDVWISGDDDHLIWKSLPGGEDWSFETMTLHSDRGYLGVQLDDLNEQLGKYFDVANGEGALITEVVADSPAQQAGFQAGDVIVKFDDEEITSSADLHMAIGETKPEQEARVKVIRRGRPKDIKVTLAEMPERDEFSHFKMIAPQLQYHHLPKALKFHAPDAEHQVIIERMLEGEEFEKFNEEMKELRDEMKALKKEMKKLKKQ